MQKLTLRQHQKLQALFDREEDRLCKLHVQAGNDTQFRGMVNQELSELHTIKAMILDLPHDHSHAEPSADFIFSLAFPDYCLGDIPPQTD